MAESWTGDQQDQNDPEFPTGPADSWDPEEYHRFRDQRSRPFRDLLELLRPVPDGSLLDLGCGTGELTSEAQEATLTSSALGLDNSASMLEQAASIDRAGLRYEFGDLTRLDWWGRFDIIVANASLQWVPDHASVLTDWAGHLEPGGQLAVQVPANADHPSHTTITEVLHEEPFWSALDHAPPPDPVQQSVLDVEQYAELLWSLGATEQTVRLQVYGMQMDSPDAVVEWTSGTTLVRVRRVLSPDLYERFVERYREVLGDRLEHRTPYFYAFKRILMWARFGERPGG